MSIRKPSVSFFGTTSCSMLSRVAMSLGLLCFASGSAFATEATLGTLLFSTQKTKADGVDSGTKSSFGATGRYHDTLSQTMSWFATGGLGINSYSSGKSGKAPDNSVDLVLGGGVRYYFSPFSQSAVPFAFAGGSFKSDSEATFNAAGYTETAVSGLFHSSGLGLRMALDDTLFFELESAFYESPLFAIEKTTTVTSATETKNEKTTMQLFAQTFGPFNNVFLSLGMKL
jgi:hypothetical protein